MTDDINTKAVEVEAVEYHAMGSLGSGASESVQLSWADRRGGMEVSPDGDFSHSSHLVDAELYDALAEYAAGDHETVEVDGMVVHKAEDSEIEQTYVTVDGKKL